MKARGSAAVLAVAATLTLSATPTVAAAQEPPQPPPPAAPACTSAQGVASGPPTWGQRVLGGRLLWPVSTGNGVRVAVLSTGINRANGQFPDDSIRDGLDVLDPGGDAAPIATDEERSSPA